MSSSVSLPSNTSLQHSDLPKKTTSDNHLHLTERKISRELLTKATSDINFNPIIEVRMSITICKKIRIVPGSDTLSSLSSSSVICKTVSPYLMFHELLTDICIGNETRDWYNWFENTKYPATHSR